MASREESLKRKRKKHLEQMTISQKKAKQIEKLLAAEKRSKDNRRKFIAGGYLLRALQEDQLPCQTYEELLQILDKTLTKNIDRRAFDLPELPNKRSEKPRKQRRAKTQNVAQSASQNTSQNATKANQAPDTRPAPPTQRTSLPPSLVSATVARQMQAHRDLDNNRRQQPPPTKPSVTHEPAKPKLLPERPQEELIDEFNL